MKSKHTTDKYVLPEVLQDMLESFVRSEEFLDLESTLANGNSVSRQKREICHPIHKAMPEQLGRMPEALCVM